MSRCRVDVDGPGLTPEGIAARQAIARQPAAWFASAAFVSGGLDPYDSPEGWIKAARGLEQPLTVVVADRVLHLRGRLGAHEELDRELAAMLG